MGDLTPRAFPELRPLQYGLDPFRKLTFHRCCFVVLVVVWLLFWLFLWLFCCCFPRTHKEQTTLNPCFPMFFAFLSSSLSHSLPFFPFSDQPELVMNLPAALRAFPIWPSRSSFGTDLKQALVDVRADAQQYTLGWWGHAQTNAATWCNSSGKHKANMQLHDQWCAASMTLRMTTISWGAGWRCKFDDRDSERTHVLQLCKCSVVCYTQSRILIHKDFQKLEVFLLKLVSRGGDSVRLRGEGSKEKKVI